MYLFKDLHTANKRIIANMSDLDKEKNELKIITRLFVQNLWSCCDADRKNNLLLLRRSFDHCELCLFDSEIEIQRQCLIMQL